MLKQVLLTCRHVLASTALVMGVALPNAIADADASTVATPRGTLLDVTIEMPAGPTPSASSPAPVLLIAPGQACAIRTDILDTLTEQALAEGYAVLRFQWSYCKTSGPALPSPFLVDEIEDLESALSFARHDSRLDKDRIIFAGKSQGSFVAYRVFLRQPGVRALALITPVCTYTVDNANQPLPAPIMVGYENYPYLSLQRRPILMLAGSNDKSCLLSGLDELLQNTSPNVSKSIVLGDHGLRIYREDGELNPAETAKNIDLAAQSILAWLLLTH